MSLISGVGDFFRGAFGEDNEEKRRRKEREAQAAAQRQQSQKAEKTQLEQAKVNKQALPQKTFNAPEVTTPKPNVAPTPKPVANIAQAPTIKTPADHVNEGLDSGKTWEQISRETGVKLEAVKAYSEATRPNYGKKKPEYKTGFKGFFEKAGDKLEANSPQDKFAREGKGNPTFYENEKFGQRARDLLVASGREIVKVPETVFNSVDKGIDETAANEIEKALAEKDATKRKALIKKITDPKGAWLQLGKTKTLDENMTDEQLIALKDDLRKNQESAPQYTKGAKRFLYGSEPLQSYEQRGKGLQDEFKNNTSAAQMYLKGKGEGGEQVANQIVKYGAPLAVLLTTLGILGDVAPDPTDLAKGGSKKAGKELVEEAALSSSDEVASAVTKGLVKEGEDALSKTVTNAADNAAEGVLQSSDEAITNIADEQLKNLADDVNTPSYQRTEYKAEAVRRAKVAEDKLLQDSGLGDTALDSPAFLRRNGDEVIDNVKTKTIEAEDALKRGYTAKLKQSLANSIKQRPDFKAQLIKAYTDYNNSATVDDIVQALADDPNYAKLIERRAELLDQASRFKKSQDEAAQAVDAERLAAEAAQTEQRAAIEAVKTEQAAADNPVPGGAPNAPNDPVPGNPEIGANNAYNIDDAYSKVDSLTDRISDTAGETQNPLLKLFNFGRQNTTDKYRSGVDAVRNKANELIYDNTIGSGNNISAKPVAGLRLFFDKFGMKDADRLKVNTYSALREANAGRIKAHAKDLQDLFNEVPDEALTAKKLYQVFESNTDDGEAMLAKMYGEGTPKLSVADLSPEELKIYERLVELNKVRNDVWYRILQERHQARLISDDDLMKARQSYLKNQDGTHSPRIYDFNNGVDPVLDIQLKGNSNKGAYMRRDDATELSQDVVDTINANPAQSMLFRLQTGMDELGRIEAVKQLREAGFVREVQPNKNWTQLVGKQYGSANGKWMDNQLVSELENSHIFTSNAGQKASDLLDVYRASIFGKADRAIKRAKTAYSPGTFLGNVVSNPFFFNRGSGINPLSQSYNMAKNVPALARHMAGETLDGDILEMQRLGIKMGNTADELVGGKQTYRVLGKDGTMQQVKDIALLPTQVYAGADDLAKLTIYKTLKSRGMDAETAALRVSQFTQDYGNAGRAVEMLADSPILGAPFARFVPELVRLTKNNIIYNPVGTAAGLYGLAALQKELHKRSGETPEEKRLREDAPGKVKIPFSSWVNNMVGEEGDISLDFPVGDSSINAARALGFNFPLEPGSTATESLIKNLAPFAIPFMKNSDGNAQFQPQQLITSMFLRPLSEQVANKDFMGRSVDDPMNKIRATKSDGNETAYSDESQAKVANRLYALAMNYSPLASEADAVISQTGLRDQITKPGVLDEGKDYYGKERTPMQSFLRSLGIKVEKNDAETRQERVDKDKYFNEDLPAVQSFLNENKDLRDSYWKLKSTSKDRNTLISANDNVSPERYKIIVGDKTGRLFEFLKSQAQRKSQETNTMIDPIYTLPPDEANQVLNLKSMYTGDDTKLQQLLYKETWFKGYKAADRAYQGSKPEYVEKPGQAKTNPRPKEWNELSEKLYSPDTGVINDFPLVKEYNKQLDQFANYDSQQRKDFTKAWYNKYGKTYEAQSAAHKAAQLDIVNKMRVIEGASPMSADVWSGKFETDSDRAGDGFGGGDAAPRNPLDYTNYLGNLSNSVNSIKGYAPINPQEVPNIAQLFKKLQAGSGGSRKKPPIGAASRGQG